MILTAAWQINQALRPGFFFFLFLKKSRTRAKSLPQNPIAKPEDDLLVDLAF